MSLPSLNLSLTELTEEPFMCFLNLVGMDWRGGGILPPLLLTRSESPIAWEGGTGCQSDAEEAKNYETAALSALTVIADLWISSVLVSDFSVIHIKLLFYTALDSNSLTRVHMFIPISKIMLGILDSWW